MCDRYKNNKKEHIECVNWKSRKCWKTLCCVSVLISLWGVKDILITIVIMLKRERVANERCSKRMKNWTKITWFLQEECVRGGLSGLSLKWWWYRWSKWKNHRIQIECSFFAQNYRNFRGKQKKKERERERVWLCDTWKCYEWNGKRDEQIKSPWHWLLFNTPHLSQPAS